MLTTTIAITSPIPEQLLAKSRGPYELMIELEGCLRCDYSDYGFNFLADKVDAQGKRFASTWIYKSDLNICDMVVHYTYNEKVEEFLIPSSQEQKGEKEYAFALIEFTTSPSFMFDLERLRALHRKVVKQFIQSYAKPKQLQWRWCKEKIQRF